MKEANRHFAVSNLCDYENWITIHVIWWDKDIIDYSPHDKNGQDIVYNVTKDWLRRLSYAFLTKHLGRYFYELQYVRPQLICPIYDIKHRLNNNFLRKTNIISKYKEWINLWQSVDSNLFLFSFLVGFKESPPMSRCKWIWSN